MNMLEEISNDAEQVIALDGREYTRVENNPGEVPNIKIHYEWNINKFEPGNEDDVAPVDTSNSMNKAKETFDISLTQQELKENLEMLISKLRKSSKEVNSENRASLDKLEKDLLSLMRVIETEREDTISKTNEAYQILDQAKHNINQDESALVEETNGLKKQIEALEAQIKAYDSELHAEAQKSRELKSKRIGGVGGIDTGDSADAKRKRKQMKDDIDRLIQRILDESLENMHQARDAAKSDGTAFSKEKTAIFAEVINEDKLIRDKKIAIENQNAAYRNNAAVLASKEFDLKLLEHERKKTDRAINNLQRRQQDTDSAISDVKARRAQIARDSAAIEEEIKKYESLIGVLNKEIGDTDIKAKTQKRKPKIGSGTGTRPSRASATTPSFELGKAADDRERARKNLENLEDKWNKKLNKAAKEAQVLISPNDAEAEQRDEISRLLNEINSSQQRSLDLNGRLDVINAAIQQEKALGLGKLTDQAMNEAGDKKNDFLQNEALIQRELDDVKRAITVRQRSIQKQEVVIKDLHSKLQTLEYEKNGLNEEIEDLTALVDDPAPTPERQRSPKRAAINKKQLEYEAALARQKEESSKMSGKSEELRMQLEQKKAMMMELESKISSQESIVSKLQEKIKIKLKIARERRAAADQYEPIAGDFVDEHIASYCNQQKPTVPVKRIGENEYMFGTLKISTKQVKGDYRVTVKKDKKEMWSKEFFAKYEAKELKNLEKIGDDQELVIDEDSKQIETRVADASRLSPSKIDSGLKMAIQKATEGLKS